jgi:protein-disulfide isomerase
MSFATAVSGLKRHPLCRVRWAIAAALLGAVARPVPAQGTITLPLEQRTKGSATAPVTVYEMADFQCPYCSRFFKETFGAIDSEYIRTGKVRWIFINLPIPDIHPNAIAAAEFAVCAATEGKFWPVHDMLYSLQPDWENLKNPAPFFQSKIAKLGLKSDEMNSCLQSGRGSSMVKDDVAGAQKSGVRSTPSFYIEGGIMEGAQPTAVFRHILDSVYKAKTKKS